MQVHLPITSLAITGVLVQSDITLHVAVAAGLGFQAHVVHEKH